MSHKVAGREMRDPAGLPYAGMDECDVLFSIVIPTYNRAALLPRLLDSIERQTCDDFEVIVVDDGSSDDTRALIEEWTSRCPFKVLYFYQQNQGKPAAYNAALNLLHGYFMLVVDSDDILVDDALEIFLQEWRKIPAEEAEKYAGIEGLDAYMDDPQRISGDRFPQDVMDSNYVEMQYIYKMRGDKKHVLRSSVAREYPFPVVKGEKDMRESTIYCRMSDRYVFRYINKTVLLIEQQTDGLSASAAKRRDGSPNNFYLSFLELVNQYCAFCSLKQKLNYALRAIRCGLFAGKPVCLMYGEFRNKGLFCLMLPFALLRVSLYRLRGR